MKMDFYKFFGYLNYLNYILWLLELNVMLLLANLPFAFLLLFIELKLSTIPAFFVAGITIGPSLMAAFESIPDMEKGVVKKYLKSLKNNWSKVSKLWIPVWFLMVFMFSDVMILSTLKALNPLKWCFIVMLYIEFTFLLSFFIVWATWKQNAKAAIVLTLKLSIKKPVRYNLNFMILVGTFIILSLKPIYLLLYGISIGLFLIHKNFMPVIQFVNNRPENRKDKRNVC